jgi:hypothetical protein
MDDGAASGSPKQATSGSAAAETSGLQNTGCDHESDASVAAPAHSDLKCKGPPISVIHVLGTATNSRKITLINVPTEDWGYYGVDVHSCQLNATNRPGAPAALVAEITFDGQCVFDSELRVENPLGYGVTFGILINRVSDGDLVIGASVEVAAGQKVRLTFPTGPLHGDCRVTLQTQMAPGALTHHQVRSFWLNPRFHDDLRQCGVLNSACVLFRDNAEVPHSFEAISSSLKDTSRILDLGGGGAGQERIAVHWSEAHRENLRRMSREEIASRCAVDPALAGALLLFADGHFAPAEDAIVDILQRNHDLCLRGGETFISLLVALFIVQRFDLVASLLGSRYGFGRGLEIQARRGGPGRGRVRWDILPSGSHRFTFDAQAFEHDNTRAEILLFQWEFPLLAAYSRRDDQETGTVFLNQGDVGQTPGLAYCDSRPDYFLLPDYIFVPSSGYRYARDILRDKHIAWQDRIPIAFWRGGTTGVPSAPGQWRSLLRIQLCELARGQAESGLIDAGISSVVQFSDPTVVHEIEESGLLRGPVPWQEWGRYKYQIDIDGNSSPWSNLFQKLLTGSTVLKVESARGLRQWFYDELVPWQNYVPIAPDLSDLMSKINWLTVNDSRAQRIGQSGLELAERLTYDREIERGMAVISAAFRYFNGRPEGVGPYGRNNDFQPDVWGVGDPQGCAAEG